jgi:hypothetical protein
MVQLGFRKDVMKINGHTTRGFWVERKSDLFANVATYKKIETNGKAVEGGVEQKTLFEKKRF